MRNIWKGLTHLYALSFALLLLCVAPTGARADPLEDFSHHNWAQPTDKCQEKVVDWWAGIKTDAEKAEGAIKVLTREIFHAESAIGGARKDANFKTRAPGMMRDLAAKRRLLERWERYLAHARKLLAYYEGLPHCVTYGEAPKPPGPGFPGDLTDGPVAVPAPPQKAYSCKSAEAQAEAAAIPGRIAALKAEREKLLADFARDADEIDRLELRRDTVAGMLHDTTLLASIATIRARMDAAMARFREIEAEIPRLEARAAELEALKACPPPKPCKPAPRPILDTPLGEEPDPPPPAGASDGHGSVPGRTGVLQGGVLAGVGVNVCPPAQPGKEDQEDERD